MFFIISFCRFCKKIFPALLWVGCSPLLCIEMFFLCVNNVFKYKKQILVILKFLPTIKMCTEMDLCFMIVFRKLSLFPRFNSGGIFLLFAIRS